MDTSEIAIITAVISIAGTIITNIIGKWLGRRFEAAQVHATEGDAAKDVADAVSALIKPMKETLEELRSENQKMRSRVVAMEDELSNMKLLMRRVNDAFNYLADATRESMPEKVDHAIKIKKGEV